MILDHQRLRLAGALQSPLQFAAQPVAQVGDDGRQLAIARPLDRLEAPFQPLEQCPVLIHQPLGARQVTADLHQARAQHLRVGQDALTDAPGVGGVLDEGVALKRGLFIKAGIGKHPLQIRGRDHALEGGQFSGLDLLLQRAARDTDETRRPG